MAYDSFSACYDSLTENVEYDKRAEYYYSLLADNGIADGILLDLGCGTGSMCVRMADKGYEVIGNDISVGMLMKAREKCAGKDILLLNQAMEELDLYGTIDCCISVLDCINHLDSFDAVKKAFGKVSLFMRKDGIFAFDVNTIFKHRNVLADNAFIFDNDDVFCAWQNSLNDDDSVDVSLDFFTEDDGAYYRDSEYFTEKAYELEDIKNALTGAGFSVLGIYDDMTTEPVKENSEKAVFVCRRN